MGRLFYGPALPDTISFLVYLFSFLVYLFSFLCFLIEKRDRAFAPPRWKRLFVS